MPPRLVKLSSVLNGLAVPLVLALLTGERAALCANVE
jgi:hypothetical protein